MTIIELKDRVFRSFHENDKDRIPFRIDPNEETMFICRNFSPKEIRHLLIHKMKVNPMMYYEVVINSPIDKIHDYEGKATFFNMVIPGDFIEKGDDVRISVVKKRGIACFFI
jgi:hypothetical protein